MEKKQPSRVKCCVWIEFHASHWGHSFWTVVHLKVTANPLNTNPNVVSPCSHICRWCHSSLWRVNKTRAKQVDMARSMEGWAVMELQGLSNWTFFLFMTTEHASSQKQWMVRKWLFVGLRRELGSCKNGWWQNTTWIWGSVEVTSMLHCWKALKHCSLRHHGT